jgi:glycosyltransferase involved in cell wall biosynthesis
MASPHVVVDAEGLTSGGGITWARGLIGELQRNGSRDADWVVRVASAAGCEFVARSGLQVVVARRHGTLARLARQQVLASRPGKASPVSWIHAANVGPLGKRRPHALIAHNALHFNPVDGVGPWAQRLRIESALARASVRAAAVTIVPSETMAALVRRTTGREARVLPFGISPPREVRANTSGRFVFVHRTAWGPHKGLGALLAATRVLAARRSGEFEVWTAANPFSRFARGFPESRVERELLADRLVGQHVRISPFPDPSVAVGDAAVIPSGQESFCFPAAEAIAADLPLVLADRPWARELCGDGASFVDVSDAEGFAWALERMIDGHRAPAVPPARRARLSWQSHVDGLLAACVDLTASR